MHKPDAAIPRLSWHERITKAVGAWREWMHVTPAEYWMDKAMKAAGFRDVIVENGDLRAALRELHAAVWNAGAFPLNAEHPAMKKAREILGA